MTSSWGSPAPRLPHIVDSGIVWLGAAKLPMLRHIISPLLKRSLIGKYSPELGQ